MSLRPTILSLCDYTGVWSAPYAENGYAVVQIDLRHGQDVRLLKYPGKVHGILAAPPCTHFALSGAHAWERKGDKALLRGLALVDACLRFVAVCKPKWWVLENPRGRITDYIGPHQFEFDPWEYAGYLMDPERERYSKRTLLWGSFVKPRTKPVRPIKTRVTRKGRPHMSASRTTTHQTGSDQRSGTPEGFARAFFEANP